MAVKPFKRPTASSSQTPPVAEASPPPQALPQTEPPAAKEATPPPSGSGLLYRFRADPRRYILSGIGAVVALFLVYEGVHWLVAGRYEETTDNAYIRADIAVIAPKVQSYVDQVLVSDNQAVKAGDLLVTLNPATFAARASGAEADVQQSIANAEQSRAQVASAEASLETAAAQVSAQRDRLTQTRAQADAAKADADLAASDYERYAELAAKGHYPKASLDAAATRTQAAQATLTQAKAAITAAQSELSVAQASYHRAEQELAAAKAAVTGADAKIDAAKAALKSAEIDQSYTELRAPFDGVVANRTVAVGQLLSLGQQTMAIVPVSEAYVIANFKETQVERMVPGQKVDLHIDAYPNLKVEGTVDSISPATGGQFSLIPMDTATGNFTKIVQRVPVRVRISDEALATGLMRPGLSVEATVIARTPKAS